MFARIEQNQKNRASRAQQLLLPALPETSKGKALELPQNPAVAGIKN
jgi:hypothetical protein